MKPETITNLSIQKQVARLPEETTHLYRQCSTLADEVLRLMKQRELAEARSCLQHIQDVYTSTGRNAIRTAIENVFLYRLGTFMFCSRARAGLLQLLPKVLHDKLMQQMLASGT